MALELNFENKLVRTVDNAIWKSHSTVLMWFGYKWEIFPEVPVHYFSWDRKEPMNMSERNDSVIFTHRKWDSVGMGWLFDGFNQEKEHINIFNS